LRDWAALGAAYSATLLRRCAPTIARQTLRRQYIEALVTHSPWELQGRLARTSGSRTARSLHKLGRRAQKRTERTSQAVVFDAPTVVFGLSDANRAKRFRDRESFPVRVSII
jgi:hypothetical protein